MGFPLSTTFNLQIVPKKKENKPEQVSVFKSLYSIALKMTVTRKMLFLRIANTIRSTHLRSNHPKKVPRNDRKMLKNDFGTLT